MNIIVSAWLLDGDKEKNDSNDAESESRDPEDGLPKRKPRVQVNSMNSEKTKKISGKRKRYKKRKQWYKG